MTAEPPKPPDIANAGESPDAAGSAPGYERRDVAPRRVLYAIVALLVGIAVAAALVFAVLALLSLWRNPGRSPALEAAPPASPSTPAEPRLEITPSADRAAIEAAARRQLHGYAWQDREQGRVRIPIEVAMQRLSESGWPAPAAAPSGDRQP